MSKIRLTFFKNKGMNFGEEKPKFFTGMSNYLDSVRGINKFFKKIVILVEFQNNIMLKRI